MKKVLTSILLILLLILSGCSGEPIQNSPAPEPTVSTTSVPTPMTFALPYYPDTPLHPITATNRTNLLLASLVYQGLFELDNTFTAHGVLCSEAHVSEDGTVWTLALGEHSFSDGSPVTATDVISSLELARTSAVYSRRLSDIQTIAAAEPDCVIITLSRPNGDFPSLLDIPIIRDYGDGGMPLGTGPYLFAEDDGPLRLARRQPTLDRTPEEIELVPIDGADDLIYAFDCGDISLVVSDPTGTNTLGYSTGYEIFSYPTTSMLYVGFQTNSGPCANPLIRQAISRSFDRGTVAVSLLSGHGSATCLPFSPHSALYNADFEAPLAYDPAAVELLRAAGCMAGENGRLYMGASALSLKFVVNTDNSFKLTIAEYLTKQLIDLGISVDLQKLAWDDYVTALERGNFDLYLGEVTLTADFDLTALLSEAGSLNYGGYVSAELDALMLQLRQSSAENRTQTANAFLELFQHDMPVAPLCFKNHAVLTQWGSISGLNPTRQNPFYNLENLRFRVTNE